MANIICRDYNHYNRALQKHISSKREYEYEMKRGGFVPIEEAEKMAEKFRKDKEHKYEPSQKAESIIRAASLMKDSKGNIKAGSRLIDGMKEVGVNFTPLPDWLPKAYKGV
jgi:hypothetical protein